VVPAALAEVPVVVLALAVLALAVLLLFVPVVLFVLRESIVL